MSRAQRAWIVIHGYGKMPIHQKETNTPEKIAAYILAGGQSRRFGSDKSLHLFRGKPLIEHVIDAVRPLVQSIFIVTGNTDKYSHLGLPSLRDIVEGLGPLGGIHTALTHIGKGYAIVLGCDTPNINRELLSYMIHISSGNDVVIPYYRDMYEPLHALYSSACLPSVEKAIQAGMRQVISFFSERSIRTVSEPEIRRFADPEIVFKNINYFRDAAEV